MGVRQPARRRYPGGVSRKAGDLLQDLNPPQREAVLYYEGPLLLLAGAGSGKTRVITRRVAYLIRGYGVPPAHLMAVTFTNKAAREMEARVRALLDLTGRGLTLGTFHSICARLLRSVAVA
ncbi:MAG: UvrD-helicase domain-containing protein, partial [Planctomycetes bacterium]|nr:UvrD-helicase domain-containing protein [Planctomycetota bacterium]